MWVEIRISFPLSGTFPDGFQESKCGVQIGFLGCRWCHVTVELTEWPSWKIHWMLRALGKGLSSYSIQYVVHMIMHIYIDIHSIFILICIHKGYMPCIPSCGNWCWPGDLGAWGAQCFQVQAEVVQVKMEKRALDAEQETCGARRPTIWPSAQILTLFIGFLLLGIRFSCFMLSFSQELLYLLCHKLVDLRKRQLKRNAETAFQIRCVLWDEFYSIYGRSLKGSILYLPI
jgi:hypothetical protein